MGERHLFVRFEECHIECEYCDELGREGREMSVDEVVAEIDRLETEAGPHAYVSLTGGEPLLYVPFLKPLCHRLREKHYKILLETNGILWQALEDVVKDCDLIAMDLKLSSVSHEKDFLDDHAKFLKIARGKETYLKIVVSKDIDEIEYDDHLCMVAAVAPATPVFLQPASRGREGYDDPRLMKLLNTLQRFGSRRLPDVRVGVQLHKVLNIR